MLSTRVARLLALLALVFCSAQAQQTTTPTSSAVQLAQDIFDTCLSQYSTGCVRPKALRWMRTVINSDEIKITEDLSVVRTGAADGAEQQQQGRSSDARFDLFEKIDSFLATHSLRMTPPAVLKTPEARAFGSEQLDLETALEVPLAGDANAVEGESCLIRAMTLTRNNTCLLYAKKVAASSKR